MRILGVDPSSSKSGIALVINGEPERITIWKPRSTNLNQVDRLIDWANYIRSVITYEKPDIVVVEECAPQRNPVTFRALVRFEAVVVLEARRCGKIVLIHKVSEARKIVLGNGKAPKEDAFKEIKKRYPHLTWLPQDKGGDDQSDAIVMALAAPRLAERR